MLKIDRCFLPSDEDEENSPTSLMYKHVVAMARDLGLECVTEGVETAEQAEFLKDCGCERLQGYYFGKPMKKEEVIENYS